MHFLWSTTQRKPHASYHIHSHGVELVFDFASKFQQSRSKFIELSGGKQSIQILPKFEVPTNDDEDRKLPLFQPSVYQFIWAVLQRMQTKSWQWFVFRALSLSIAHLWILRYSYQRKPGDNLLPGKSFQVFKNGNVNSAAERNWVLISSFTANKFSFELYISAEVVQCFMQCKIEAVSRESR